VLSNLNLIHFFSFYLMVIFLISTVVRLRQYRTIMGLVRAVPDRWPRLFGLIKEHRGLFLTRATLAPGVLALALWGVHMLASRLIWPEATLTTGRLLEHPVAVPLVALFGLAMLAMDVWGVVVVRKLNRTEMEQYFDQAEHWLTTWKAPVVRVFTLGFINPRRMVAQEVRTALESATQSINNTLWWVCLQTGLRISYGLSVWATYAWTLRA
jgi:hypothetical protein